MTQAALEYRETLGRLVLLRTLKALAPDAEELMLDALDAYWQQMSSSERESANQYAAALAQGKVVICSSRHSAANESLVPPLSAQRASSQSKNSEVNASAEFTFILHSRGTLYRPPHSEGGGHAAA